MNPLLIQLIGGMLGGTSPQQNPAFGANEPGDVNPDYTGDPSEAINKFGTTKPYQDSDFLTKIFHPTVAAQTGQLNNAAYNDQLQSESQARVWKTKMFDNSPELKNEFGDNWRGAYVKYGNLPAVNSLYTNPIATATKFASVGGPNEQALTEYEGTRNKHRSLVAEGLLGNPEAAANAANSNYRLTDARNITGLTNETKRGYDESLGYDTDISRKLNLVPIEQQLEKLKLDGDISAFPNEQDTRLNRGTIAKATSGEEVSDLPYALNAAKNEAILKSGMSRYGSIKPIGGFSVNDDKTLHYGVNKGAISPAMMQMESMLANPMGFSGDSGVSGVKLPDGSKLPMKETKIDPISGNPVTQNDQPKKAMNTAHEPVNMASDVIEEAPTPFDAVRPSISSMSTNKNDSLAFMNDWPEHTKKAYLKALAEYRKNVLSRSGGSKLSPLEEHLILPIGAALKTPFNY